MNRVREEEELAGTAASELQRDEGSVEDSTAGLGHQTLRTGRPLVGGLSFHDVWEGVHESLGT